MRIKESARQARREEILIWLLVVGSWFPLRILMMGLDVREALHIMKGRFRRRSSHGAPPLQGEAF